MPRSISLQEGYANDPRQFIFRQLLYTNPDPESRLILIWNFDHQSRSSISIINLDRQREH